MTEKDKTQNKGIVSDGNENTASVTFGGESYSISRLKAGKFYDALKVYMDMVKDVAPKTNVGEGEAEVQMDTLIVSMFQNWPDKMVEFISICCSTVEKKEGKPDLSTKFIKEEAYPEEITKAFSECLELNRVAENLKNFTAPMGDLGAEASPKGK